MPILTYFRAQYSFLEWQFRYDPHKNPTGSIHSSPGQLPLARHPKHPNIIKLRWHPPRNNSYKLNFDGSVINGKGAVGFVIRDSNNDVIYAKLQT